MPILRYKDVQGHPLADRFQEFADENNIPVEQVALEPETKDGPKFIKPYGPVRTAITSAVTGAPAAVAGLGGGAAGAVVGNIPGAMVGGGAAALGVQKLTDMALEKFAPEFQHQLRLSQEANPRSGFIGNLASQATTGVGAPVRALTSAATRNPAIMRMLGQAGLGGLMEAGMEKIQGESIDPERVAMAAGGSLAFSKLNRLGKVAEKAGESLGGRLKGIGGTGAPTGPIKRPNYAAYGEEWTKNPNMTPEQDAALRVLHNIDPAASRENILAASGARKAQEEELARQAKAQSQGVIVKETAKQMAEAKAAEKLFNDAVASGIMSEEELVQLRSTLFRNRRSAMEGLKSQLESTGGIEPFEAPLTPAKPKEPTPTGTEGGAEITQPAGDTPGLVTPPSAKKPVVPNKPAPVPPAQELVNPTVHPATPAKPANTPESVPTAKLETIPPQDQPAVVGKPTDDAKPVISNTDATPSAVDSSVPVTPKAAALDAQSATKGETQQQMLDRMLAEKEAAARAENALAQQALNNAQAAQPVQEKVVNALGTSSVPPEGVVNPLNKNKLHKAKATKGQTTAQPAPVETPAAPAAAPATKLVMTEKGPKEVPVGPETTVTAPKVVTVKTTAAEPTVTTKPAIKPLTKEESDELQTLAADVVKLEAKGKKDGDPQYDAAWNAYTDKASEHSLNPSQVNYRLTMAREQLKKAAAPTTAAKPNFPRQAKKP